jgi:hypothetical protein
MGGFTVRALALSASAISFGVLAVYLASVVLEEDADPNARAGLVAGSLAVAGAFAVAAALLGEGGVSMVLLTAASTMLIVWGVLGLLTIGIPLLVGGALAAMAAREAAEAAPTDAFRTSIAAAVGVALALGVAFALT